MRPTVVGGRDGSKMNPLQVSRRSKGDLAPAIITRSKCDTFPNRLAANLVQQRKCTSCLSDGEYASAAGDAAHRWRSTSAFIVIRPRTTETLNRVGHRGFLARLYSFRLPSP